MRKPNHYSIITALVATMAWQSAVCSADDNLVEAYVLRAVDNNGKSQSIVLTKSDDFVGPRLYHKTNEFTINGKRYATADIDHIRIEKTLITAINEVNNDIPTMKSRKVYNINGQIVKDDASSLSDLPKGIYIINGKKYIAK